jgi:hypothetical protein
MGEMMSNPTNQEDEKFVASTSWYKPKEPGEDYVDDPSKAHAMAEAEKPFRDEKADIKKKIPGAPSKPKEPSAFARFTGIGMGKYNKAVEERNQAIEVQGDAVHEYVKKGYELDDKAKEAAEKAEKDYVPTRIVSASLPPSPKMQASYAPKSPGTKGMRLPREDEK